MSTIKGLLKQKKSSTTADIIKLGTDADIVSYVNTSSGLSATTVQGAIDEIVESGVGVTGVKGNEETNYRTGQVNLTPSNIGAISSSLLGANSGVAELDENGKVPTSELPDVVLGQMLYGGTVSSSAVATLSTNAKTRLGVSTASVTLPTTPTASYESIYFLADNSCSSGVTLLGNTDVRTGDWIVATGGAWKKVDNSDAVVSVNSKTGIVVLAAGDIPYSSTTDTNTVKSTVDAAVSSIKITNSTVSISGSGNAITGGSIADGQLTLLKNGTYATPSEVSSAISSAVGNFATKASTVDAGTYCAVTVNNEGIVTWGGHVIQVISHGASIPDTCPTDGFVIELD